MALTSAAQQVDARLGIVGTVGEQLQVRGAVIEPAPAQRAPIGRLDRDAGPRRPTPRPQRSHEGHECAQLSVRHGHPRHAGAGQAVTNERRKLRVGSQHEPLHHRGPELAALAVGAVAARAEALVVSSAGVLQGGVLNDGLIRVANVAAGSKHQASPQKQERAAEGDETGAHEHPYIPTPSPCGWISSSQG